MPAGMLPANMGYKSQWGDRLFCKQEMAGSIPVYSI
jgi:hypothetical protein